MGSKKPRPPKTPALRVLDAAGVAYELQPYDYVPRGGARASSAALGAPLHQVVKTLVMQDQDGKPLVVCQHGDREVSTKALARALGRKSVEPCTPETAQRHSGYQVGGTSPFGLRKAMPVYVEASVFALDVIWINGGARGLLVKLGPQVLVEVLGAVPVEASQ
ncbi:MAG: aminoacyl-tRNA deacylase [Alphaproteobacteria bacterium]|nr:aminoacyl-tRNA deacylase [Alphaproteobacteria bacterium]